MKTEFCKKYPARSNLVEYEILDHIAVVDTWKSEERPRGWSKEINLVRWGKSKPCYDIRSWNSTHRLQGRGKCFSTLDEALRYADFQ